MGENLPQVSGWTKTYSISLSCHHLDSSIRVGLWIFCWREVLPLCCCAVAPPQKKIVHFMEKNGSLFYHQEKKHILRPKNESIIFWIPSSFRSDHKIHWNLCPNGTHHASVARSHNFRHTSLSSTPWWRIAYRVDLLDAMPAWRIRRITSII